MTKAELFFEYERLKADYQKLQGAMLLQNIELKRKEEEISSLKDKITILQQAKFAPQTEKMKTQDPQVFNELEEALSDEQDKNDEEEFEEITYKRKKSRRPRIPKDLPRIVKIIDLDEKDKFCPHDGSQLKEIGEEILEQLEIIPENINVLRFVRKKYACPCCDDGLKVAPPPPVLIPKSMATAALIAYIAISKYQDALPLYRQEKIYERLGFNITRQSMARWLINCVQKLMPIYNLLQDRLLEKSYVQIDETPVQVLREEGKKATTKSYMWVRHTPVCKSHGPIVLFNYAPTRGGHVPIELLEGFSGYLQCDGYSGYDELCRSKDIKRVGCWDHTRRYFHNAFKTSGGKGVGKKALVLIGKLYKVEEKIKKITAEEKLAARKLHSIPILNELKGWIDSIRLKINPTSVAGKAIKYATNEWKNLIAYTADGNLNISNIWVENKIRPFCLGRKNWMFSVSVEGAEASAMYYSLIETAKANDMNPYDYLKKVLTKLPEANKVEDFEKLLPLK